MHFHHSQVTQTQNRTNEYHIYIYQVVHDKQLKSPQLIAKSTNVNVAGFTKRVHTENVKEKKER